jgi:hypothetical protein
VGRAGQREKRESVFWGDTERGKETEEGKEKEKERERGRDSPLL